MLSLSIIYNQKYLAWSKINFAEPSTKSQVEDQLIWWNSLIKIDNKPFRWKKWYRQGVVTVSDILDQEGNLKKIENIQTGLI